MTPLHATVNDVDLSPPGQTTQVARGSVVSDSNGTRQATLIFKAGTQAQMRMPDDSTQPLTHLHLRATEVTVGPDGPDAMPGALPASSAYTYAVDYSVQEAIDAGAKSVEFDRPIVTYTENFRGFPVGMRMPAGSYDASKVAWAAELDGRVVKILSIDSGKAVLDVDGAGNAATPTQLQSLEIDDDELTQLALLYGVGATLWRVPATHFSPKDYNCMPRTPLDIESSGARKTKEHPDKQCPRDGARPSAAKRKRSARKSA